MGDISGISDYPMYNENSEEEKKEEEEKEEEKEEEEEIIIIAREEEEKEEKEEKEEEEEASPCSCTTTSMSGLISIEASKRGCSQHSMPTSSLFFCYIMKPEECEEGISSSSY